jgi:tetratricopeptide (TPR) repeat protein
LAGEAVRVSLSAVINVLIGFLGAVLTTNQPAASSNAVGRAGTVAATFSATADSSDIEKELQKLMDEDDRAQGEIDQWIRDNDEFAAKGAGIPPAQLRRKIQERLEPIRKAYEDFIERHPTNSKARVAFASFLGDTKDEESAEDQLEKALALDTNNPAIYNNLANIYGHIGPVKKAFEYYGKAIGLNPIEPVYYHNFGTTVYLFRNDAMEYFNLTLPQVFARAFELYSNSMRLDPDNFPLASDVAQTYYGIQPMRIEEALRAWTNALHIAHDEIEREGVYVHFARIKNMAGRFAEARAHLDVVTNDMYLELKRRIERNISEKEDSAKTNATRAVTTDKKETSPP